MEQLLTAFGIDAKLIVIQIINFVVLMGALSYFLYKPVLRMLNEREEKIAQGIRDAEEAAQARESAEVSRKEVLSGAHKEAEDIGARAKVSAEERSSEIVNAAQVKAESIITDAKAKSEHLQAQARAESEEEVARMAILAAERVLREGSAQSS